MKKRKKYTAEFKREAIRLAESSGKPVTEIERDLGLWRGCISGWRRQLARKGKEAFPGQGHLTVTEERIRRLEQENEVLRQERDILKKAVAIFSRPSK